MTPRSLIHGFLRLVNADTPGSSLRLLVVSSPRVGNTWVRTLLTRIYGFDSQPNGELAVHDPADIPWGDLPPRCIVQLHWHPEPAFTRLLREHRFRRLTLVRHPLDVLVSILQLSQHTRETGRWLDGEGGDETGLIGASPRSKPFLRYATGRRARALLSVSPEWWSIPGTLHARYEDLVADSDAEVRRLTSKLGRVAHDHASRAIEECAIDRLVSPDNAPHFWQGKPGLWKKLITADDVARIGAAHHDLFRRFGYDGDPDPGLTAPQADANWAFLRDNPRSSRKLRSA